MDTATQRSGIRRSASREASRERHGRPPPVTTEGPVGRATAQEWNDIAEGLRERIYKLESIVQQHTYSLSQVPNIHPSMVKRIEDLGASVDRRFTEGGDRFIARINKIERDMQIASHVHENLRKIVENAMRHNGPTMDVPPGCETYNYATPERPANTAPNYSAATTVTCDTDVNSPDRRNNDYNRDYNDNEQQNFHFNHLTGQNGESEASAAHGRPLGGQPNCGPFGIPPRPGAQQPAGRNAHFGPQPQPQPQPVPQTTAPGPNSYIPRDFGCAAQHCQSSAHASAHYDRMSYKIREKGIKELPTFDGEHSGYRYWKNKLTDHMAKDNDHWRVLLKGVEAHPMHIEPQWLFTLQFGNLNGWQLAVDLWNLISDKSGKNIYERRITLAHGNEGNGFELWRKLFTDYEGGDEVIQNDGRTRLQTFPVISNKRELIDRCDDWQEMCSMYGRDIGHASRRTMLLRILPDDIRADVLKQPGLPTTEDIIAWLRRTTAWDRSEMLLKHRHKKSISAVMPATDAPGPGGPSIDAPIPTVDVIVEAVVAALGKGKGKGKGNRKSDNRSRSPSPSSRARSSFPKDSCYHCGKEGHSRTANEKTGRKGCPEFAALLKKNGGKLPAGYKGAFEKHVEAFKKGHVNALTADELSRQLQPYDSEDDSSDDEMPRCNAFWQTVGPEPCCNPFGADTTEFPPLPSSRLPCTPIGGDVPLVNRFSPLNEAPRPSNPVVEEKPDPIGSLSRWATVRKPEDKMRRKKGWTIKSEEDIQRLADILSGRLTKDPSKTINRLEEDALLDELANLVNKKGSSLAPITRASKRVWAMIDSGSAVTVADCAKHFGPACKVVPGKASRAGVKYANASGGEIANRGEALIRHRMTDGSILEIPFQDASVQCPIISVRDYVTIGSVVKFRRDGGSIKMPDGRALRFQERAGVYWTLLDLGFDDDLDVVDHDSTPSEPLCPVVPDDHHEPRPERRELRMRRSSKPRPMCDSFRPAVDSCASDCLCVEPECHPDNVDDRLPNGFRRPAP